MLGRAGRGRGLTQKKCMHFDVVDSMSQVDDLASFETCREIAKTTGVLVGGSAGLNACAAARLSAEALLACLVVSEVVARWIRPPITALFPEAKGLKPGAWPVAVAAALLRELLSRSRDRAKRPGHRW